MALTHKEADGALGCDLHRASKGEPAYIWHDPHAISSSNVVWECRKADPLDGSLCSWGDKVQLPPFKSPAQNHTVKPQACRSRRAAVGYTSRVGCRCSCATWAPTRC